jgi:UDP-glucose 4-epimerase
MFSRNETKQFESSMSINDDRVKYVIGDIKNYDSLFTIMKGVDYVFHAAALKHIDLAEKSPDETIKINVLGTSNVVNAAIKNGAKANHLFGFLNRNRKIAQESDYLLAFTFGAGARPKKGN